MAQTKHPIILFTYAESVVGRRTEWYLTLRGIPYQVCQVDNKMPRPVLDRLDVHYRRIPILAIGRDLYCDSRCIIDHLERLYLDTPRLGSTQPFQRGIDRILETWAFDTLFGKTAQLIPSDAKLVLNDEWLTDRFELTGAKFSADALRQTLPVALSNARLHLQIVEENLLADGRKWLSGGEAPGLSDVHVLWVFDWMLRPKEAMGMQHAYPTLLNETNYPNTFAWAKRMEEAFQAARTKSGPPTILSDDETVKLIESAEFWQPDDLEIDESDPVNLEKGDETDLIALDSAPTTGMNRRDVGVLEGLTITSATVRTQTANGRTVRIHYPRSNVRVSKAGNASRLKASEIP